MAHKNIISRKNEKTIIAYQIPNSDDLIIGRDIEKNWLVKNSDGIMSYSTNDMEEIYYLDLIESDLERLTWPA